MAISIADSFSRATAQPRFSDEVFATLAALQAFAVPLRYPGMVVTVLNKGDGTQGLFWFNGGTSNANIEEFKGGGGFGIVPVEDSDERDAIPEDERSPGMFVYIITTNSTYQLQCDFDDVADNANWVLKDAPNLVTYSQTIDGAVVLSLANITGVVETIVLMTSGSSEFNSISLPPPTRLTKMTLVAIDGNTTTIAVTGSVDPRATGIRLESGDSMTFVADLTTNTWKLIGRNY